ncbi:superoxide dismutase [Ni] [Elusimicrobiota bacterium]
MKIIFTALVCIFALCGLFTRSGMSHCEIPCGIYGDEMRFNMIEEHIMTIEKSMKMINKLSDADEKNFNQIVRWVDNKETHANYIQDIVSQYFLAQRIKIDGKKDKEYAKKLSLLHEMIIYAMKAKQGTDLKNTEKLKKLLEEFKEVYF